MTSMSLPQTTPPKQDVFRLYDDNSAIVESKNDTFYALRFFNLGGRYKVTDCECRGFYSRATCRHKEELETVLETTPALMETPIPYSHAAATKAILTLWDDADVKGLQSDDVPCAQCGGAVVRALVHSRFGQPSRYMGVYGIKRVCETCGVAA